MARRDLVAIGLLLLCIIVMLFFKKKVKEGFATSCSFGRKLVSGVCILCSAGTTSPGGTSSTCSPCPAGSFGANGACNPCSSGTFSAAGAASCSGCPAGTVSAAGASNCTTCSIGTYTSYDATVSGIVCKACPPNTTTASNGSTAISQCICGPGTYGTSPTCTSCTGGYYCPGDGTRKFCPAGLYAPIGNYGLSNCRPCLSNSYRSASNDTSQCISCGTYTTTLTTGSTAQSQCKCGVGYYGTPPTCSPCGGGKSSPVGTLTSAGCGFTTCSTGFYLTSNYGLCAYCPNNTYGGGGSNLSCTPCGSNSSNISSALNTTAYSCKCIPGSYGTNGNCISCGGGLTSPAGATLASQCVCPTGNYLNNGSCVSCPTSIGVLTCTSTGFTCKPGYSNSGSNCVQVSCSAGQYVNGSSCAQCGAGFYSTGGTATSCLSCAAGTFSSNAGAGSCTTCPSSTVATCTTTGFTCKPGYSNSGSNCVQVSCSAGQYVNGSSCAQCGAGFYSTGGTSTSCLSCAAGTFSGSNAESCTTCAAGTYSAASASACTTCQLASNAASMTSSTTSCTIESCLSGFTLNNNQCKCSANSYLNGTTCETCPSSGTSPVGSTAITQCTCPETTGVNAFSALIAGSTTCRASICSAGYYLNDGQCIRCPSNGTSPAGSTSISQCACPTSTGASSMNQLSSTNSTCTVATCSAGYKLENGECSQCSAGSFSSAGSTSCTSCAAGSYSAAGAATCSFCGANSYSAEGATSCTGCPSGSTSGSGSTAITSCSCSNSANANAMNTISSTNTTCTASSCSPGFSLLANGTCQICGSNKYGTGGTSQCMDCPQDLSSPAGSTSAEACSCPSGQTLMTLKGVTKCAINCPTMTKPPNSQGSDKAMLFALASCGTTPTFNYKNNGVSQTTNPCTNSFYDFDQEKCVDALGITVGTSSGSTCSSSTVYSTETNACVPVRVAVKPGNPQLNNTTGTPSQGDFRDCKTVDQGDCTIVFKDSLGFTTTTNPCTANNQVYNFATKTCVAKTKSQCCNYTDPLKAAADKSCAADTSITITKNASKCPTGSRTLCCNNAYATNSTCIRGDFWRPSYQFTASRAAKCAAGFEDYQESDLAEWSS